MEKPTRAEPVLVLAIWDDAWGDAHEIVTIDDASLKHRPTVMQTVGWLLMDTEKGVSLFNERCLDQGEESYRGRTFIPRAMVRSVTPVIKPRKARKRPPAPE
jgi:hypothetical protein